MSRTKSKAPPEDPIRVVRKVIALSINEFDERLERAITSGTKFRR